MCVSNIIKNYRRDLLIIILRTNRYPHHSEMAHCCNNVELKGTESMLGIGGYCYSMTNEQYYIKMSFYKKQFGLRLDLLQNDLTRIYYIRFRFLATFVTGFVDTSKETIKLFYSTCGKTKSER